MKPTTMIDVVVVGAGLSGLQAAHKLQTAGYSCHVLEATAQVGGKTRSVLSRSNGPGVNDVGAAWINDTSQTEMYKLFQRYDIEAEVQRATGNSLAEKDDGSFIARPYGQRELTDEEHAVLEGLFSQFEKSVAECFLENPQDGPNARELDAITFEQYCTRDYTSPVRRRFANGLARALLGVEASELSALYMINYVKSGTGLANLVSDGKDGGQYLRARQGMMRISVELAAELVPGTLHLEAPVQAITQELSTSVCTVSTATGTILKCRRVIVSVPTPIYSSISFSPPLPASKTALATTTALGYYSKMILVFDTPWWREAGLSGILSSDKGPISFTRDTSVPADGQWSISCFLVGNLGRRWSRLSNTERKNSVWEQFKRAFGPMAPRIPMPINTIEMEWAKETWFRGAPSPVMAPGLLTTVGAALRAPAGLVHFVGTETAGLWKGYMEGAVRSGQRGAIEVAAALQAQKPPKASL